MDHIFGILDCSAFMAETILLYILSCLYKVLTLIKHPVLRTGSAQDVSYLSTFLFQVMITFIAGFTFVSCTFFL